jgi:ornithine cyclodeaminase
MNSVFFIDKARVESVIGNDAGLVKELLLEALRTHHEKRLVLPVKQYVQRSPGAHSADRIIAMPVFLHDPHNVAGIKWIGSHPENYKRGMERANAFIILNDVVTNAPVALVDGSLISSMRTLAMTLVCIDTFHPQPRVVACLGMGRLGKLHARHLRRLHPSIESIRCYSRADYDEVLADPAIVRCGSHREALEGADLVITATASDTPYIRGDDVGSARLIVHLSLMDCTLEVFRRAGAIVVDDLEQCRAARKVFRTGVESGAIDPSSVEELSRILFGRNGRREYAGCVLVNPIGMAVEDILVAKAVYDRVKSDPSVPVFET